MTKSAICITLAALALGACSGTDSNADDTPGEGKKAAEASADDAAAPPETPASPAPSAVGAVSIERSNDLLEFSYSFPAEAAAIPKLRGFFERDRERQLGELQAEARADKAEAKSSGYSYNPHGYDADWKVVTDLPRFLSLSGEIWTYTGGAHGNYGYDARLWDRETKSRLEPLDLFSFPVTFSQAIRTAFCDKLDAERKKRRGAPVDRDSGDSFDECIDPVEQTVILGSSNGRSFDRIGILVGPYAAGSYAEGAYDITLPVTRAVIETVKPAYRGAFSVKR